MALPSGPLISGRSAKARLKTRPLEAILRKRSRREVGMPIELSQEEKDLLVGLLEKEIEETRTEIRRTEGYDYKEGLKAREKRLRALLSRLRA
jgi:hypothetical protein